MKRNSKCHPLLQGLKQIVGDLARAFGINAEVVLHDLQRPTRSIVAIAGNITGRTVGGPVTDLVLRLIRNQTTNDNLLNYQTQTSDGKMLRSSTLFLRDEKSNLIGCLCINIDLAQWAMAKQLLSEFCSFEEKTHVTNNSESFEHEVVDILHRGIRRTVESIGKPISSMSREDRLWVVKTLDENGTFLIKGSISAVAKVLSVSRYTVYNYIEETRVSKSIQSRGTPG